MSFPALQRVETAHTISFELTSMDGMRRISSFLCSRPCATAKRALRECSSLIDETVDTSLSKDLSFRKGHLVMLKIRQYFFSTCL